MRQWLRLSTISLLFVILLPMKVYAAAIHVGFLRVVLTATDVPGGSDGAYYTHFSVPTVSLGRVAFYGVSNRYDGGVYNNIYNYVQLVADIYTKLPGGYGSFLQFRKLIEQGDIALVNHRMVVFKGLGGRQRVGLYRFFNNKLSDIVSLRTPMPGAKGVNFAAFDDPWLLDDASVVFIGRADGYFGVFGVNHYAELKLLMNAKQTAIPQGKGNFTNIHDLAMSPHEGMQNYAFIGEGRIKAPVPYGIRPQPTPINEKVPLKDQEIGIYMTEPQANGKIVLVKMADKNSKIPEGLGYFTSFSHLAFDNNQIAFVGNGILGEQGVYMSTGKDKLIKIADLKMIPPQADSQFSNFDELLFRNGIVIFHAETKDRMKGLFLYTKQYGLFKVVSSRDRIDNKQVADVHISRASFGGRNLALLVNFTDGAEAVYVCTISISPY